MPKKKYLVDLSADDREQLQSLIRRGQTSARKLTRARSTLALGASLRAGLRLRATIDSPAGLERSAPPETTLNRRQPITPKEVN
jgi:hypothetical protein